MRTVLHLLLVSACAAFVACATNEESSEVVQGNAALGRVVRASDCGSSSDDVPEELRCTGLYSDWDSLTIDPAVQAFAPGFELWSDGAEKTRWIYLPPGTQIDASDMNAWVFPVGTKLWKEFRLPIAGSTVSGGVARVETRMLRKVAEGRWTFATYVWSPEQDSARRVTAGIRPFPGTQDYEVPAERTCNRCHGNKPDRVLGFEAVLLAAPEATGLTYDRLVAEGRISRGGSTIPTTSSLQIPGDTLTREAIGRLHANCGIACHNASGPAPFSMRIESVDGATPTAVEGTSVFQEAIGQPSFFTPDGASGTFYRIQPTDEGRSTIFYRMSQRGSGGEQMPPVATHLPDPESLQAMRAWIRSMTGAPYPPPGPR
jgi:hypothetical protein